VRPRGKENMRRKLAVVLVGVLAAVSGVAACGVVEDEIRQRAQDEVDRQQQRLEEEVEKGRTQIEQRVEEEVTRALEEGQ
jgi:sensor domain CHASE-containing protein